MASLEQVVSRMAVGTIAPVALMLAGWWGSLALFGDGPWIPWATVAGVALGTLLDGTVLRDRLGSLASFRDPVIVGIALFYTVMVYGFFMGLPVANLLVGAGWGFAVGRRHAASGAPPEQAAADVRRASLGSAGIMLALCCATAAMAFNEPSIAFQVRGMLGLSFVPSRGALVVLSLVGGTVLVVGQYFLTAATARWAARSA